VECKLRSVNFSRVSDARRAFRPAFRITGIYNERYRSTMGVIFISLGTGRSAEDKPQTTRDEPWTADDNAESAGHQPGSTPNN